MNLPQYQLRAGKSLMVFEFISEGPKGRISKLVKFSKTNLKGLYNLSFGDKNHDTGDFDDQIVSNNGDSETVLATVVAAVYVFTDNIRRVLFTRQVAPNHVHGFIKWALQST